jgi:hypothetical protein
LIAGLRAAVEGLDDGMSAAKQEILGMLADMEQQ